MVVPVISGGDERELALASVHQRLEGLRDELRGSLARERADLERSEDLVDRSGHHPAEASTDLFLREWSLATMRSLERELAAVDDAIQRLDQGSDGMCAECGRPIEPERLAVRPQAIRRADCEHRYRMGVGPRLTVTRRQKRTGGPASP